MQKPNTISRRDFVNGAAVSLALGTALSPVEIWARNAGRHDAGYPPSLTGMRGSHDGSFEVAHAIARHGKEFAIPQDLTDETYDLVVVGGGISGLAAAKFFRDRSPDAVRILILDNHDDFGGHARRNELDVDGETLLCYGGSQSLESPSNYSPVSKQLLDDLAIDPQRFYEYYDFDFESRHGLKPAIFFDKATYGENKFVLDILSPFRPPELSESELIDVIASIPIAEADQQELARLLAGGVDYMSGLTRQQKLEKLQSISYLEFLNDYAKMPPSVQQIFQDTFLPIFSVGWEALSAREAAGYWFPGTHELGVQADEGEGEPYIFHFPDGNASIARALVRDLIPPAIPGNTMEDLVVARADYGKLDDAASAVRLRLNSTAIRAEHTADKQFVDVTYVNAGVAHRVRARHVVMACYNNMIPYLCPEVPKAQAEAIGYATKIPFAIASVAIRNWRSLAKAGHSWVYSPGDAFFKHWFTDFPVSMGDYQFSENPDEPIVLSGWYSPTTRGLPAKAQYRAGRAKLLQMSFDDFEQGIYSQLNTLFAAYGFDADRDIAAITINRWSHGYAYEFEGIGIPLEYNRKNGPHILGRQRIGRISIANSDSEAYAYVDGAIDAADRAVNEQLT
ncbi:MAG: NAD(P)-binding protein [Pseudomonadota bacterium]